MSAALVERARTLAFNPIVITSWAQRDVGKQCTPRLETLEPLDSVIRGYESEPFFGCTIYVVETNTLRSTSVLNIYRIRKGAWQGRYSDDMRRRVYPYSADLLCAVPITDFAPVEPWQWTPDADVLGRGDDVLEAARAECGK